MPIVDAAAGEWDDEPARLSLPFRRRAAARRDRDDEHIRDLIEQVLFTAPGRARQPPDFGSGLLQLVFAPNSDELAATTQFLVQGALQQWLGDLIEVEGGAGRERGRDAARDGQLHVGARSSAQVAEFTRGAGRRMIYFCCDEPPAQRSRQRPLNGIDFLEVVDDRARRPADRQRNLLVHFVNDLAGLRR